MGWFPNNNHPRDKATYDFHLTAPQRLQHAIGNGELASKVVNGDGRRPGTGASTTRWRATCRRRRSGVFDDTRLRPARRRSTAAGQPLKFYDFIESAHPGHRPDGQQRTRHARAARTRSSSSSPTRSAAVPVRLARRRRCTRSPAELRARGADEVALRRRLDQPRHARARDRAPVVRRQRRPGNWRELWFNEGWATWWAWYWGNKQNGSADDRRAAVQRGLQPDDQRGPLEQRRRGDPRTRRRCSSPRSRSTPAPARCSRATARSSATRRSSRSSRRLIDEHATGTITTPSSSRSPSGSRASTAGFTGSNLTKLDDVLPAVALRHRPSRR